jgi:hypothetical protein
MLQVKLWVVVVVVVPAVVSVVSVVSVVGLAGFGRVADRCSVRGVGAAWLAAFLAAVAPNSGRTPRQWSQSSSDSARLRLWLKSGQFDICYFARAVHDERPG